jgi:hypothetical protein
VKTPTSSAVNTNCIAAYMTMHITPSASGLYMENVSLIECAKPYQPCITDKDRSGFGLQTTTLMIAETLN